MESNNLQDRLVAVLGMHRSGTSMMMHSLSTLGVVPGDKFLPPAIENPKGFWEDSDILSLNEEMLLVIDSRWDSFIPLQKAQVKKLCLNGYQSYAIDLLKKKQAETPYFGFKDPRTAKILPFWQEVFHKGGFSVNFVVIYRNPLSVTESLRKRNSFKKIKSHFLWLNYLITIMNSISLERSYFVNYDDFIESSENELHGIAKFLSLEVEPKKLEVYQSDFLDKNLRNNIYSTNDLLDSDAPSLMKDIYTTLQVISSQRVQHNSTELTQKFAQWKKELWQLLNENQDARVLIQREIDKMSLHNKLLFHLGSRRLFL